MLGSETALGEIILGDCTKAIISDLCELCMESRPGQKGKIGIPKGPLQGYHIRSV